MDNDRVAKDKLRISPADVCIEVENRQSSRHGRLPRWNLCITIPKSLDGRGTIAFDFGATSLRTIALSKLIGGPVTYPADPDAAAFKAVWCSPETNPAYQEIITQRQPGLSKQRVSTFLSVPRRYKPRVHQLVWGHAYYFVWPSSFDPKFPAAFELLAFENNKDWSCALSSLPESGNEILADWLKSICSVDVEYSSSTWSLLYPFLSTYSYDGRIEVPAVGNLVIGCGRSEEADEFRVKASSVINGERIESQLPDKPRSVVALTYTNDTPDVFELSGSYEVSFRFRPPGSQELRDQPMVWGEFESPIKGSFRVPMHTVAARQWLGEVRANRAQLERVTLPQAAQGELTWRNEPIAQWNRSWLNRRDGLDRRGLQLVKLAREELDQVQTVLRSTGDEVRVSFFGFGEHYFPAVEKDHETVCLSRRLRARMQWLQKEVSLVHGDGWPVSENISDQDLIDCFLDLTPPRSLAGHYQSIRRSIDRLASTHIDGSVG